MLNIGYNFTFLSRIRFKIYMYTKILIFKTFFSTFLRRYWLDRWLSKSISSIISLWNVCFMAKSSLRFAILACYWAVSSWSSKHRWSVTDASYPIRTTWPSHVISHDLSSVDTSVLSYKRFRVVQSCALLNWIYFRFRCGCTPVPINLISSLFHHVFAIFKNVVYSLEPGDTPIYSASHQAPNYAQRS